MAVRTPCRWWSRNTCASAAVTYARADGVVKAAVPLGTIGGLRCAPPQPLLSSPSQLPAETLLAEMLLTATLSCPRLRARGNVYQTTRLAGRPETTKHRAPRGVHRLEVWAPPAPDAT